MKTSDLFAIAKEALLADGREHAPVMYVEYSEADGKEAVAMFYFADFGAPTQQEEHYQFFTLGLRFGLEHQGITVSAAALVNEAWVAYLAPGERKTWKRPQDAPNRREELIIQIVEVQPTPSGEPQVTQSLKRATILRPAPGVVDLLEQETGDLQIMNRTLPQTGRPGCTSQSLNPIANSRPGRMYRPCGCTLSVNTARVI